MNKNEFDITLSVERSQMKETAEKDERLTNEEALLYQDYATKKEGIEFSEQADEQSYAEAEKLISEIKEKGIELEGMDLSEVDLKDIAQQDFLGEKLEQRVAHLAVKNEDPGIMGRVGEVMGAKGIRKIVMLLSLFTVLSANGAEAGQKALSHNVKQGHREKLTKTEKLEFEGVRVAFEIDEKGNPIRCAYRTTKHFSEDEAIKMDIASNKMLVEDYIQIATEAVLKHGGTMNMIQAESKAVRRDFLVGADLYHKLLQNNMKDEARLVRKNMLEKIVRIESSMGAKIFDRKELAKILNSEK